MVRNPIFSIFTALRAPAHYLFTGNIPAPSAYFSLDGGNTKLADFGVSSDPSDFLNSGVQGGNDPFNEFYSGVRFRASRPSTRRCSTRWASIRYRRASRSSGQDPRRYRVAQPSRFWAVRPISTIRQHDAVQRDDQDRERGRQCGCGRQAVRQWRPERFARQRRHGELERHHRHADADRKRLDRGL